MGNVILYSHFSSQQIEGLLKPIIYCFPKKDNLKNAVSINLALSIELNKLKLSRRTLRLAACFEKILKTLPDNVVIKDFDVMFNPNYQVDVLKILIDACKNKPFSIIWPGEYKEGKLFYAEKGCLDFKTFSIEDYDITCII